MSDVSRRAVLTTGVAGAGAVVLAACGGGSSEPEPKAAAAGQFVADVTDVPATGFREVKFNGASGFLAKGADGGLVWLSAKCTHAGCLVKAQAAELVCACHASKFDASGTPLGGPAKKPLRAVKVTIQGDKVVTA